MKLLIVISVLVAGTVGDLLIGDGHHVRDGIAFFQEGVDAIGTWCEHCWADITR